VEFSNFPSVLQLMDRIEKSNRRIAGALPSHREWLAWLHELKTR
jgi:hypothetical protein